MRRETPVHERMNLAAICAAQFLTLAGMTAVLPLLPLYLQQIGITDRDALRYWTGILGSAPFAVAVFSTPLWGALADRVGHKPMVVRSVTGIALTVVGMGLSTSPFALLGWRAVQGAVSGVFPAAVALVSSLTPEARVGRSLAILQSARAAGGLSGPLLGGFLADLVGIRGLFFGVGAIAAASAVACALVLREPPPEERRRADSAEAVGWRELLAEPGMLAMLALVAAYQVTAMASWPTLALYVEGLGVERQAVGTTTGLVIFAAGLPALLTATLWARLGVRFGVDTVLAASLIAGGAANAAVGLLAKRIDVLIALRMVAGVSMSGFIPLAFQWTGSRAPAHARGRVAGLGSTAMMAGNVVGPLLGGWIAVHIGLAATFWLPGLALATAGIGFALVLAGRRRH
jgi:MFS transporter, DHA1 family, multidrug resistance protein